MIPRQRRGFLFKFFKMDLKKFFSAIDETIVQSIEDVNAFYHSVSINTHEMPSYKDADIAIIGVRRRKRFTK